MRGPAADPRTFRPPDPLTDPGPRSHDPRSDPRLGMYADPRGDPRVALRPETASVAAPWGGEITFRVGAAVFFLVTIVALLFVGVAAWSADQKAIE